MNLWVRLLVYLITVPWRKRFSAPTDVSRLSFRVGLFDLDTNLHVNNGRYLTIADLGRLDLLVRAGLLRPAMQRGWAPVLSAAAVRFRRELKLFERFTLESQVRYWDDTLVVMEHRFRFAAGNRKGAIAATLLMTGGLYDRKAKAFVPVATLMRESGLHDESPPLTPEIAAILEAGRAMRAYDQSDETRVGSDQT
ncbi:MAG: thioesterase family protein [Pseudomonadota bacterium]